jgi:hypothetical protein
MKAMRMVLLPTEADYSITRFLTQWLKSLAVTHFCAKRTYYQVGNGMLKSGSAVVIFFLADLW